MRTVDYKFLFSHAVGGLVRNRDLCRNKRPFFASIFVVETIALLVHRFEILVDRINAAGGVHPTSTLVKSLVDEELAPSHRTVGVQPLVAHHLQLGSKEE